MEKYKLCPTCGIKNSPTSLECSSCETDLTSTRVIDDATVQPASGTPTNQADHPADPVRVCECGTKNPPNARKCAACGEDISDIQPTPQEVLATAFALDSLEDDFTYELTEECTTIGREHEMREYLSRKPYVSRTHANLIIENGELIVENLSGSNSTYINNVRMNLHERKTLTDGDEVAFGGYEKDGERQPEAAYFSVRIGPCM